MTINQYKQQHNAIIAAHTYQSSDIQAVADIVGDSFALAQQAAASDADTVILCGVRFMAEGIKILSPQKTVILAEPTADCPMAQQIDPQRVIDFKATHPEYAVVAYINTTAALKAIADVCVTSSSSEKIVRALPQKNILFIPDQNLGDYVRKRVPEKNILTWNGYCPVHAEVTADDVARAKVAFPNAKVAAHPECTPEVLALADMVGSTAAIIDYIQSSTDEILVITERGVVDKWEVDYPGRLHQVAAGKLTCKDMKRTSLASIQKVIDGIGGEVIEMDLTLMVAARGSLENMLRYG